MTIATLTAVLPYRYTPSIRHEDATILTTTRTTFVGTLANGEEIQMGKFRLVFLTDSASS